MQVMEFITNLNALWIRRAGLWINILTIFVEKRGIKTIKYKEKDYKTKIETKTTHIKVCSSYIEVHDIGGSVYTQGS